MKFHLRWAVTALLVVEWGVSSVANAALVSRLGGAAFYDTDLNVTWLTNANLAASNTFGVSGINPDGSMYGTTAQSWIGAMNASYYFGYNDWRLPSTGPVNGTSYNYSCLSNGTTDCGYNISAPGTLYTGSKGSEMAYLFFNDLGNKAYCDPSGVCPQPGWGLTNVGPFSNFQIGAPGGGSFPGLYWSGTDYPLNISSAFFFDFGYGRQNISDKKGYYFALVVRPGDSPGPGPGPVPLPGAVWLFGSGLAGLIGFSRRRKTT